MDDIVYVAIGMAIMAVADLMVALAMNRWRP
jgi:hypothetical protein